MHSNPFRAATALLLLLPLLFLGSATADSQYKTRPDLSPPVLNITIPASGTSPGYIFVGPYGEGPEQPAGYIMRDNGDLVWSSLGFLAGWVGNLQVSSWQGEPVLTGFQGTLDSMHGHGFGHPTILNQKYQNIKDLRGGDHKVISIHEFNVQEESGTALVEVYQPTVMDLSPHGGEEGAVWIVDSIFQELDIATGELIFQWSSLAHIDPSESNVSLPSTHGGDALTSVSAWDYLHINSVDKDRDGNYLVSGRHVSALFKIDGRTGSIIWQLGGKNSDFEFATEDVLFGFQHDARFVSRPSSPTSKTAEGMGEKEEKEQGIEYVSLFDNAARSIHGHMDGDATLVHDRSRAKVIRLDMRTWSASLVTSLEAPDALLAPSQGNVQTLGGNDGHLFVNWGQAGAITEYDGEGKAIFHAYLDSSPEDGGNKGVQNYRGFKFEWHGFPEEMPAIVALDDDIDVEDAESHERAATTTIYVSWNGDTEAAEWRFYEVSRACLAYHNYRSYHPFPASLASACQSEKLGRVARVGFETALTVGEDIIAQWNGKREDAGFYAQAVDKDGRVISTTGVVARQRTVGAGQARGRSGEGGKKTAVLQQEEVVEL